MPTFCLFCDEEAYLSHCIRPAMCQKHFELMNMVTGLVRDGRSVTTVNVRRRIAGRVAPLKISAAEVPAMMSDFRGRW